MQNWPTENLWVGMDVVCEREGVVFKSLAMPSRFFLTGYSSTHNLISACRPLQAESVEHLWE